MHRGSPNGSGFQAAGAGPIRHGRYGREEQRPWGRRQSPYQHRAGPVMSPDRDLKAPPQRGSSFTRTSGGSSPTVQDSRSGGLDGGEQGLGLDEGHDASAATAEGLQLQLNKALAQLSEVVDKKEVDRKEMGALRAQNSALESRLRKAEFCLRESESRLRVSETSLRFSKAENHALRDEIQILRAEGEPEESGTEEVEVIIKS
ncbi:hypothetical protein B0H67DRAFT_578950, partial [Lasiosphaeris hirsuta]